MNPKVRKIQVVSGLLLGSALLDAVFAAWFFLRGFTVLGAGFTLVACTSTALAAYLWTRRSRL